MSRRFRLQSLNQNFSLHELLAARFDRYRNIINANITGPTERQGTRYSKPAVIAPIIFAHTLSAPHANARSLRCVHSLSSRALTGHNKSARCTGSAAAVSDKHTKTSQLNGLS